MFRTGDSIHYTLSPAVTEWREKKIGQWAVLNLFLRPQEPKSERSRDAPAKDNYVRSQTENRGNCGGIYGALGPRDTKAKISQAEENCKVVGCFEFSG
jgi:hypothetical protein